MEKIKQEQKEKLPPRNILTHSNEVFTAIAAMEGEAWVYAQSKVRGENTFQGALDYLRNEDFDEADKQARFGCYTIYGNGGINRYIVLTDGTVMLSRHNATRGGGDDAGDMAKAESLGFGIFD